ncbi:MAG: DUF177 domain-containing protein [Actinobacteria bacterium]|nr:DUF177 domain-containing protein [Actinomycetota bacterium]
MREIDVRDLLGHPGASREVGVDEAVEDLRTELAEVPADRPLRGSLLLESVVEGILVSGPITGHLATRCARCLTEIGERPFTLEVRELYVVGAGPDDDEYAMDPAGSLDPEQMVRDAVLLSMPFSPLCRPDCLGLCERCGGDRNLGECTCSPQSADPRWAALDVLLESRDG